MMAHVPRKVEDMSSYSEGQTHQLMEALQAVGFTAADVTKLGQFKQLPELRRVLNGQARIVRDKYIIDCDCDPYEPEDLSMKRHLRQGQLEWDPDKVLLHVFDEQREGSIHGNDLYEKLKPILNACFLDHLLAHPHLIPEEWKGKHIFFWGTIYQDSAERQSVRYLYWDSMRWTWNFVLLDCLWRNDFFAAILIQDEAELPTVYPVKIDYSDTFKQRVATGHYDWNNSDITEKHFPIKGEGQVKRDLELINYGKSISTELILEVIDARGYRPATIEELLAFGATYPEVHRELVIVALGSVWCEDDERVVAYLGGGGRLERQLNLVDFWRKWNDYYHFLVVRK